jgi:hypothetical protein
MNLKIVIPIASLGALAVLGIVGFVLWRSPSSGRGPVQPFTMVTQADAAKNDGGDLSPKAGTTILAAMPYARARKELVPFQANNPAVATVAAVGADESGLELHVVIENRGKCTIKTVEGVAYGFEARGASAKMNQSGAYYLAFKADLTIEPGKKKTVEQKVKYADQSTLAVAHVDRTTCTDGTSWERK